MEIRDYLSDDGQAVLALCSSFALPPGTGRDAMEPFRLSEWNELAKQIDESPLRRPAALQGQTAEQLAKDLGSAAGQAERIARLLERSGRLALELESLFSRGMWAVTRVDEQYPAKLRKNLKNQAPSVLFGAGEPGLLRTGGVAVVGSRNIDAAGTAFALEVGRKLARSSIVISGGARGTDRLAMSGSLEAGGKAVGVLTDSLERTVRQPDLRQLLLEGQLALLTPYVPTAGFSIGAAMGRNKIIYGLADFAVVVSSELQTGGTWAGATEALKGGWCPVFVRDGPAVPKGNRELLKLRAIALPEQELQLIADLPQWFRERGGIKFGQQEFFG
jgi:predicted Rossmann fold nucleotide-binding protein DprA/Smf involved in DNA uptake